MNRKPYILIAEDDMNLRLGLEDTLENEGFEVCSVKDGKEALRLFGTEKFDLVLLDVMMPFLSGYDVCREIRKKDNSVPIIMLTAKSEEVDKVVGLELGADDYVTKPFGIRELQARISAALRRARLLSENKADEKSVIPDHFILGSAHVDSRQYHISIEGCKQDISVKELKLLHEFYRHPNEVLTRDQLLNAVWGIDYFGTTRTLDQHIAQLRKKVDQKGGAKLIQTVHGIGYRYVSTDAKLIF